MIARWLPPLLLALLPVGPIAAQDDTLHTEAVIQLDIEDGPSEVLPALVYNGTLLLTMRRFLALSELHVAAFAPGDSVLVIRQPGALRVRFDPNRGSLVLGDTVVPLPAHDAVWWDSDLFVATTYLERAFHVAIRVEWADAAAFVGRSGSLPVVRRARRERQRALLGRGIRPPSTLDLHPPEPTADGAMLAWSLTAATGAADNLALDLGLGAKLLGGSVELRPQVWSLPGGTGGEIRGSWVRAWPGHLWLRQVRLGDVQTNGRRAQFIRGFVVTNAPFVRSSEFDVEQVVGRLPPGWEVELYDRGRLMGYDEVDPFGAYRVPVELRYGQNPFELVLYGPTGEVVRQKRTIRVPFSRLPAQRFEYALAAGQCRLEPCDGVLSADARYGLSHRVTVQAGWDAVLRDSGGVLWQPYATASAAVMPPLTVTAEAVVNGLLRGTAAFEPTPDLRLSLGHTEFAEAGQLYPGALLEHRRSEGGVFWRPGPLNGSLFFQVAGVRSTGPALSRSVAQASATARLGALRYTLGLGYDHIAGRGVIPLDRFAVDLSADAALGRWARSLEGATGRATLRVEPSEGLSGVSGSVGRRLGRLVYANVGIGWFRSTGLSLDVSLSTALRGPRAGVRNRLSTGAGTNSLMFANGSVIWDPDTRLVRWGDGGDLGRAGIQGVLYLDDNANGVRDPGEPGLANIPVVVGGWLDRTDANGRFVAWELFPFELLEIVVDSLAFDDPRLVLPTAAIRVRPTPNSFITIDVPVVVGAELTGWVLLEGRGIGGVPVVLRDLVTGREISFITYSDGAFYRPGVPPGEYEIFLPQALAERLDVLVPPLHIFVPPGLGEKRVDSVILDLIPRGGTP